MSMKKNWKLLFASYDWCCQDFAVINIKYAMKYTAICIKKRSVYFFQKIRTHLVETIESSECRGHLLGQSFVSSGCGRCLLQDEDHSGSYPLSFLGLCRTCSGTSPERFWSGPELVGSWESCQDVITHLISGFLSYWTLETTSLWPFPQIPQKLELGSPLVI